MHVVIFEGSYWKTFAPLALSRPVFMLGTGMATLLEKQVRHLAPSRLTLWVRPEFEELARARIAPRLKVPTAVNEPLDEEPALLVSGRTLHVRKFAWPEEPSVVADEPGLVRCAYVKEPGLSREDAWNRTDRWLKLLELPRMPFESARMVESLWDLVSYNEESLIEDYAHLKDGERAAVRPPAHAVNAEDVYVHHEASLAPGVVLDGSKGPVIIDRHASVGANSVLVGPCYVGPYAVVRPLTVIRPGTSIGTMCKVGGEISNSIIFGYSNKSHDGYLGDSYVGKWVNLGAGTCTSNIKNTYGPITMKMGNREVPTGRRSFGSVIGDHTKTAILTRLMSGTYLGFCCQLAGSAIAPRFLPSYTYWTDRGAEAYRMDKAVEVVRRVFGRRDRELDAVDENVMRYVAETAPSVEA